MSKRPWIRGHDSLNIGGKSYFTCKVCNKSFDSKLKFKEHAKSHNKN